MHDICHILYKHVIKTINLQIILEKSKNKDYLSVYTIVLEKEKYKVKLVSLAEFWTENTNIRINNHDDKNNTPNYETEIQKQIHSAMKNKHLNWHNTQHFAHWCRYTKPSQRLAQVLFDIYIAHLICIIDFLLF